MYANIYQIRTNKHKFDKSNYISNINQKNNYDRPLAGKYSNKKQSSINYKIYLFEKYKL